MNKLDTENAKELHQHRQSMYDAANRYRRSFISEKTGLIDTRYLEYRKCPVCQSNQHRKFIEKNGGQYVVCNECEMVFLNPVFRDDELIQYYANNNAMQAEAHHSESDFYNKIYTAGINLISRYKDVGLVLDIGCSSGCFLDIAKRKNYKTHGIELNKLEVPIARSKGHIIWDTPLNEIHDMPPFDVITLWDVFEHIKDGIGYLNSIRTKLTDDGMVFLQIPNAGSLAARIMRQECNMFDGLEHVNLYSAETIEKVANASDFNVLSVSSVIDEIKPTLNYLNYDDPYQGAFKDNSVFSFFTSELIHSKLLGYKLQVILRSS